MTRQIKTAFKKMVILAIAGLLSLNLLAEEKPNIVIIYMDDLG
ncbi:MAG TPA: hypothetical protein VJ939_04800 [Bacteroidales bacterium]|nr:hypothetical protein [Bacteroidales bacterium]